MMQNKTVVIRIVLILVILFCLPAFSSAQAPPPSEVERATIESDRDLGGKAREYMRPAPQEKPTVEEKKEEKKEEGAPIEVKKINLSGVESFAPEDFSSLISPYENKTSSIEELTALTKKIEKDYLKKGIVAVCFLPPQEIRDGAVTLRVVEAKMGKLDVKDHKFFNKNRVNYYWQLKPGDTLRYDKISRSLQHANMNPDRETKATLVAGEQPGTTDVIVDVESHFPLHSTFVFDKEGSTYTGLARTGFGGKHNNFLGLDDTFMSGYMFGDSFYDVYAYHKVPITPFGTSVLYGYSYSRSEPKKDFERFNLKSVAHNAGASIHQDLFQKDNYAGEVYTGLDIKNKNVNVGDVTSSHDRLRILRVGSNLIHRYPGSITYIRPEFSQGLPILEATEGNFLESRGADSVFSKHKLGIKHKTLLPFQLSLNLNLLGQFAQEKLTPQEEVSLGGIDTVRGYPTGTYLADTAFQSNSEILFPAFMVPKDFKLPFAPKPLREELTGLVFVDYAYGQRRDPLGTEQQRVNLMSYGAGMRIQLWEQGILRLEWGFPVGGNEPLTGSSDMRFHISLNFEDKIFDEAQRISKLLKENKY